MTTFVYTLASRGALPEYAFLSIQSLLEYTAPETITVFFTPPREEDHVEIFKELGVDLRLVDTRTESFTAFHTEQNYGEKTWLCTVSEETVVFLDCDTLIFGDIETVITGDFEFKARPGTSAVRQPYWRELFTRFDQPYMNWMPNAGFMIFKEGIHHEIENSWLKFLNRDLDYQHGVNHKEQYSLALAVGDYKKERMTPQEHAMLWNDELLTDAIVNHIGKAFEPDIDSLREAFKGSN